VPGVSSWGEPTLVLGPPWLATDSTDPYDTPDPSPPLPGSLLAVVILTYIVPLIHGASSLRTHRYRSTLFALGPLESKVQCGTVNSRSLRFALHRGYS